MTNLLIKTTSIILSATLLPVSALAYSASHFKLDSLKKVDPHEVEREAVDEQRVIWDTECREEMDIPGGDVKGSLRFNLNRCVNSKMREDARAKRRAGAVNRRGLQDTRRADLDNERQRLTNRFMRWNMKKRAEAYRNQSKVLPQTRKAQKQSFQNVRARNRRGIRDKENAIRKEEQKRNISTREARQYCSDLRSLERAQCIRDKIKELMADE